MSYSPVSHKRPYGYDSPVSNPSSEYTTYPNGFSCPPPHPNPLVHNLAPPNQPLGAHSSHSLPRVYSGPSGTFPPPQPPSVETYNYQYSSTTPSQQFSTTPSRPYEELVGAHRVYTPSYSSKETGFTSEPQFHLTPNHYTEISNKCDDIVGILSKFDRSDIGNINQLVDSAKALYDVFIAAEQNFSPNHSPAPPKTSERPKKRTKNNQAKLYCHSCNCTDTPEWRKGPLGPRTLCNACGLIWAKLSKKKAKEAQLTVKNGKTEVKASDSRPTSTNTTPVGIYNNDSTRTNSIGESPLKVTEPSSELKDEKIDDKKLTLSFLLS